MSLSRVGGVWDPVQYLSVHSSQKQKKDIWIDIQCNRISRNCHQHDTQYAAAALKPPAAAFCSVKLRILKSENSIIITRPLMQSVFMYKLLSLSLLVVSWRENLCFSEISEKTNLFAVLASLIRFISTIMRFYSVWFWIRMWTGGALLKMKRPSRKRCDELKVLRRCWCCELRY